MFSALNGRWLAQSLVIALVACSGWAIRLEAQPQGESYQWRYYRPGNTGIQGDYCEALIVGTDGNPWIAGYNPSFEEGGFSRLNVPKLTWQNFSNVDFEAMGHPESTGIIRISDFARDSLGNLWMATGRGGLFFSPSVGASSLQRFGADNSPIQGGWSRGVEVAPDGTIWFSAYSTAWGAGGIAQFNPSTGVWRTFDNSFGDGQIAVQKRGSGKYFVWVNAQQEGAATARYDSETDLWQEMPNVNNNPALLQGKNVTDPSGNTWLFKWTDASLFEMQLDCRRPDGSWFQYPTPPFGTSVADLRAKSPTLVLVVDGSGVCWRFNGSQWSNLGAWNDSPYSYDIDQDKLGNVFACGIGGAARRDALTGQWQRYRVTNTSQYDSFTEDLTIGRAGRIHATANAAPGVGGMVKFDGARWIGYNNLHYGLGVNWPFNGDNSQRIYARPRTGEVLVNPIFEGLFREENNGWTDMAINNSTVGDMLEDTFGRLWVVHAGGLFLRQNNQWLQISDQSGKKLRLDRKVRGKIWALGDSTLTSSDGVTTQTVTIEDFPELNPQSDQFKGLAVTTDGDLWIGANTVNLPDQSTVIRMKPGSGTYTLYQYGVNWPFSGQYVMPVAATPDGRMWYQYDSDFGIDDQGLGFFDGTLSGTFPAPFEGQFRWGGLPHAGILDVEQTGNASYYELWISCASRGIAVLTVQKQSP